MNILTPHIASALQLPEKGVDNTLSLLDEGCTIPFISRYRKERTGHLNDIEVAAISNLYDKLKELIHRKDTIIKSISEQNALTDNLQQRIENCWDANELEDIYLPYKPKRRTRAQTAREQGLEPLATLLLLQRENHPQEAAKRFVKGKVADMAAALKGAQDIIAEQVSEDERARHTIRSLYRKQATISSKVVTKMKGEEKAQKFANYFDFSEPLHRCSSHRLLAMRRGEAEGVLRINIAADDEECIQRLLRQFIKGKGKCQTLVAEAVTDGFKRLLQPSMETEFATLSKQRADEEAIKVFSENLRQLLLSAPLGQKRVMGIDPGFRTGCKIVCLDDQGNLLCHDVIKPHAPIGDTMGAANTVLKLIKRYKIEAIAIGNGTAGRETSDFIHSLQLPQGVHSYMVSEDGASVYSASETARKEFPHEDVTVRGAVSIGRRLMDPLAELVKIEPKSIGVGQYQHDVDQAQLKKSLDTTVALCVNMVGVNLNTASQHLLTYVSGLGPALAKNIIDYRQQHGTFSTRSQLKKVPRLGPAAFQQCAGFLKIPGSPNPLDNSAVHPERYRVVEQMAKDCHCSVADLMAKPEKRQEIKLERYVSTDMGMPTLTDIMRELEKPGRDPRQQLETFQFDNSVKTMQDLAPGMELPGIVTNITNFGAFVDIGIHQDGLVHISQLSDRFISDPTEIVKLHQQVKVKVIEVDESRHRIALSMRGIQ